MTPEEVSFQYYSIHTSQLKLYSQFNHMMTFSANQFEYTLDCIIYDLQATANNIDDSPWNYFSSMSFFKPALSQLYILLFNSLKFVWSPIFFLHLLNRVQLPKLN